MSTKTVTNAMELVFNGFKDKYASLFAGVHVRSSACLSVSLLFSIVTFVTESVGPFQQQKKKQTNFRKREIELKMLK